MKIAWDREKAARNVRKHGISFEEAAFVFSNPLALIFDDEWHSEVEPREIIIGHAADGRLLVISFTTREENIRIISARLATAREQRDYEEDTFN
jgi:uncharacterized DUF497 family protein